MAIEERIAVEDMSIVKSDAAILWVNKQVCAEANLIFLSMAELEVWWDPRDRQPLMPVLKFALRNMGGLDMKIAYVTGPCDEENDHYDHADHSIEHSSGHINIERCISWGPSLEEFQQCFDAEFLRKESQQHFDLDDRDGGDWAIFQALAELEDEPVVHFWRRGRLESVKDSNFVYSGLWLVSQPNNKPWARLTASRECYAHMNMVPASSSTAMLWSLTITAGSWRHGSQLESMLRCRTRTGKTSTGGVTENEIVFASLRAITASAWKRTSL